jgi:D-alanyl-D-alanine carboxypeptidase
MTLSAALLRGESKDVVLRPCLGIAFVLILTVFTVAQHCQAFSGKRLPQEIGQQLDRRLSAVMEDNGIPGAVAGAIRLRDKAVWTSAQGLASVDNIQAHPSEWTGQPMTEEHIFRIGSLTKTFTATLILQLAAEDKLSLNDSVESWLPGYVPGGSEVTVRQLLQMTSGLSQYATEDFIQQVVENPLQKWRPRELIERANARLGQSKPATEADSVFFYTNTNYILLGLIAEKAADMSYAELFRTYISQPYGLDHTSVPIGPQLPANGCSGYLQDQDGWQDMTCVDPSYVWSAGAVLSSLHDVLTWSRMVTQGQGIASTKWEDRLDLTPAAQPALSLYYGLGIFFKDGAVGHNGTVLGFQSSCYRYRGYIVIALTNSALRLEEAPHVADAITNALMQELSGTQPAPEEQDADSSLARESIQPDGTSAQMTSSHAIQWTELASQTNSTLPEHLSAVSMAHRLMSVIPQGNRAIFKTSFSGIEAKVEEVLLCRIPPDADVSGMGGYDPQGKAVPGTWWITPASSPDRVLQTDEVLSPQTKYDVYWDVEDNWTSDQDPAADLLATSVVLTRMEPDFGPEITVTAPRTVSKGRTVQLLAASHPCPADDHVWLSHDQNGEITYSGVFTAAAVGKSRVSVIGLPSMAFQTIELEVLSDQKATVDLSTQRVMTSDPQLSLELTCTVSPAPYEASSLYVALGSRDGLMFFPRLTQHPEAFAEWPQEGTYEVFQLPLQDIPAGEHPVYAAILDRQGRIISNVAQTLVDISSY